MFESVLVVGAGRAGSAIAARLAERGLAVRLAGRQPVRAADRDLVLLCVPDGEIGGVAASIPAGPWIAHVSGATPLAVLDPHPRRFSVHPLQTFRPGGGAAQLDGAWGAVTAETPEARERALWLARTLGLHAFDLADADRALYHAGAVIASNFLVTLYRTASRLVAEAGAPSEALVPLMRQTIANGFELTGPIARGDWSTVEAHLAALRQRAPEVEPLYRAFADATRP